MLEEFGKGAQFKTFQKLSKKGHSLLIEGLWDAPKALLACLAQQSSKQSVLIITGTSREENRLIDDLTALSPRPPIDLPAWETLPGEAMPPSPDIVGERYEALRAMNQASEPSIVVASLQAVLQKVLLPKKLNELYLTLRQGETHDFETLIQKLEATGYQRAPVAADKGEYSVRGGIIDIFPVSSPDPFRLEFWGDEVESIRTYDPVGQTSVDPRDEVEIAPATEKELLKDLPSTSVLEYLGKKALIFFDDLALLEDRYISLGKIEGTFSKNFLTLEDFLAACGSRARSYFVDRPIGELSVTVHEDSQVQFEMFGLNLTAEPWKSPFQRVAQYASGGAYQDLMGQELLMALGHLPHDDCHLKFLCQSPSEEEHLKSRLQELSIPLPKSVTFESGYLSSGFALPGEKLVLIPTAEITRHYKVRRQKQRSAYHQVPSEAWELASGDAVVHMQHGIGIYHGVEKQPNAAGIETEYFLVEYADKARVFVPLTQSHLISKYVGGKDQSPKLNTIGSGRWKKTKEKTETAILGYASDLLQLYARRQVAEGYACPQDGPEIHRFEDEFAYLESEDQASAITDVKTDLVEPRVMDRLVCGDVGYGKTEVAMRAAFKMVVEGNKQVAILVPTTVLAMQHFETFRERMGNYPISIEVLSRFRTPKQVKQALEGLRKGSVDILIGTHRIISKDVTFKNLGLVVIDEEHRFGVKAKEHLKKLRDNVDCLTLSATPIPRTLYMSLVGARDLSVINTPPDDRLPIQTMVCETSDALIKQALQRELARDGQAFVVHNRVETIDAFAAKVARLVPEAKVVMGHGQMHARELDEVFHKFKSGEANILVCTTIIENGVDIANANTIIIDRADRFGLAELYQIRGRVGRWNRRAYAYLLVPKNRSINETAQKRLDVLLDARVRGGGMRIAMRDLEIRGAGDILGMEQSGHVSAIGFHLYCKLLKRTVDSLMGNVPSTLCDTKLDFQIDARLPEDYVNESSLRMEIYQRFGEATSLEDVDAIYKELKDRFGKPPEPVVWLYHLMRIRVFASLNSFVSVKIDQMTLVAERKKGQTTISNKVLLGKIKKPERLEAKVIGLLKKNW